MRLRGKGSARCTDGAGLNLGVIWRLLGAGLPCISKSSGFCNCSKIEDSALPLLRGAWQFQAHDRAKRRGLVHVRQLRAPRPACLSPVSLHLQQMRDPGSKRPPAVLRPRTVRDSSEKPPTFLNFASSGMAVLPLENALPQPFLQTFRARTCGYQIDSTEIRGSRHFES